ncbi:MAG TPA: hypothetical protein VHG29_03450 [Novosphingobium sp.]|nr:hypothetical protein [Novosphingobium sp.]
MTSSAIRECRWRDEGGGEAVAKQIADFLAGLRIAVEAKPVADSAISGMTVKLGRIVVDPSIPAWPGDMLHEAGHLAVSDPAQRSIDAMTEAGGLEMAAIAWSYAAARALGVDPKHVFHAGGYHGGGPHIAEQFAAGRPFGVPLLALWGLTSERGDGDMPAYPAMRGWLRPAGMIG